MRDNYGLTIVGDCVQLVPYRKKFVNRYHVWMQSEELLELTASEPLTIDEEYDMQKSWKVDPNKCTFIILTTSAEGSDLHNQYSNSDVKRMIGDVNLFLSKDENGQQCAEVDIMIAEKEFRRLGCGRAAVRLMLWYATKLGVELAFAKINEDNVSSRKLFESLGFQEVNYVAAFREYELRLDLKSHTDISNWFDDSLLQLYPEDGEES